MDQAMEATGSNGKFQILFSIIVSLCCFSLSVNSTGLPFFVKSPNFICRRKDSEMSEFIKCNTEQYCKNDIYEYKKDPDNSLYNLAYTFDLYCEKKIFLDIMSTGLFIGGILNSFVLAPLPDKYGRLDVFKKVCLCSALTNISLFFTSGPLHLIINFISFGFFAYSYILSMTLICEFIDKNNSGKIMSINNAMFPFSGIIVSIYFYTINNWKILFFFNVIVGLILVYFVYMYMVESPRWLNSMQKHKEKIEVLCKIAEFNGNLDKFQTFLQKNKNLLETEEINITNQGPSNHNTKNEINAWTMLKYRKIRNKFLILIFVWWAIGSSFWGLVFNLEHLGGNMYLASIITFAAEMIAELASGACSDVYGRKKVMIICSAIGGITYIIHDSLDDGLLKHIILFLSSVGISSIFNVIFIFSAELFPTCVRSSVNSILFVSSRLGAMASPYIIRSFKTPTVVFGVLCIISAVLLESFEETLGKELQDNFTDEELEIKTKSNKPSFAVYNKNHVSLRNSIVSNKNALLNII